MGNLSLSLSLTALGVYGVVLIVNNKIVLNITELIDNFELMKNKVFPFWSAIFSYVLGLFGISLLSVKLLWIIAFSKLSTVFYVIPNPRLIIVMPLSLPLIIEQINGMSEVYTFLFLYFKYPQKVIIQNVQKLSALYGALLMGSFMSLYLVPIYTCYAFGMPFIVGIIKIIRDIKKKT